MWRQATLLACALVFAPCIAEAQIDTHRQAAERLLDAMDFDAQ